jgi:hypothetical protein
MSHTFVSLSRERPAPGFWINDGFLEIWLRLLALHLPEPNDRGEFRATYPIRNDWLLASRGYFTGCIPHSLREAWEVEGGQDVVRRAIDSLHAALSRDSAPLDPATLDLLGIENGQFTQALERWRFIDIAHAFLDLLDGAIEDDSSSNRILPGTVPYVRAPRA